MSSFRIPYKSKNSREVEQKQSKCPYHTPWSVLNIIYEICENHLLSNPPTKYGYAFTQKYDKNHAKSDILLEINFHLDTKAAMKRPAIIISRENIKIDSSPTMGQSIGTNVAESETTHTTKVELPITITTIANGIGMAEQFMEYISIPFMYFAQQIESEYGFHKFRAVNIGKPAILDVDSKDAFRIQLTLDIEYYDTWMVKGDHLKLKTFTTTALIGGEAPPFLMQ
jgi:hypothetical protein